MTREANAFQRLRERVSRPGERFDRIENGLAAGWPDVNYCLAGREGWIEIKAPRIPAKPDTALFGGNHPPTIEQWNWFLRQFRAGGRGFLFIATEERLLMVKGSTVATFNYKAMLAMTLAQWLGQAEWEVKPRLAAYKHWCDLRELLTA